MSVTALIAEAERLEREADRLIAEATADGHAAKWLDPRNSLLTCAGARPLLQQARELRADAREASDPSHPEPIESAPAMSEPPASPRFSKRELDAAVAAAMASAAIPAAAAAAETAQQIAARQAEAREVETDELVATITGDATFVARSAAQRKLLRAEEATAAAEATARAKYEAEAEVLVAQILAA